MKPTTSTRPLNVLLVDDEPSVLQVITAFLTIDGHTVEQATNGWEGLEKKVDPGRHQGQVKTFPFGLYPKGQWGAIEGLSKVLEMIGFVLERSWGCCVEPLVVLVFCS